MNKPHPYRYHDAFTGQLARLERLCGGVTTGANSQPPAAFIGLEHRGASPLEMARYNRLLGHVELLITDWVTDGAHIKFATVGDEQLADPHSTIEIADVPRSTTFVSFEPNAALELESQPRSRIDGFYVREIGFQGKTMAELTFVCTEPGWRAMHLCLYSDAMEIGARVVIAEVPIGEPLAVLDLPRSLRGNTTLSRDPALIRAVSAAAAFLEDSYQARPCHAPIFNP